MLRILLFTFISGTVIYASAQTPCVNGFANGYPCKNIDLMAEVTLSQLGATENTNDIWGWTSPNTGREYALVGCNNGTSFIDITDPVHPVKIGFLPTHTVNSLWRDLETDGNYAFIISEASNHGMQIFDLTQLDNVVNPPKVFTETKHYNGFGHCHTISINRESHYAYCNGTNTMNGGLHIVDISDPLHPVIAGGFSLDGYTHDCYPVIYQGPDSDYQGHEIVFACNATALTLVDATDKTDCEKITKKTYPQLGYVHQGWLTHDQKYFLLDDELDEQNFGIGSRTHIFDVQDLDNIIYKGNYTSTNTAIDHNLYVIDQFVYQSNYTSGLRILDAARVANTQLTELGYFDVTPSHNNAIFSGTWSNYPWFKSGNVIVSDMYDGFVIVKPRLVELEQNQFHVCGIDETTFQLSVIANLQFPLTVGIENLPGSPTITADNISAPGNFSVTLSNLSSVPVGTYNGQLILQTTFGEAYHFPISIEVEGVAASVPTLTSPLDGSSLSNSASTYDFSWDPLQPSATYTFELATDNTFSNLIESQTTTSNTLTLNGPLNDGVYYWRVKSETICGDSEWSSVHSFSVLTVGIPTVTGVSFTAYPNPAGDRLFITFAEKMDGTIEITNAMGKLLQSLPINDQEQYILDISDYAVGMYFLRYKSGVIRFLKE